MLPAKNYTETSLLSVELFELDANPPALYIAAVSGGPDSLAMLVASAELARRGRIALECCYVDHGMRPVAAEKEADFVESVCRKLGVVFHYKKLPELGTAPNLGSLEAKLRHLRYECFQKLCVERSAAGILLGHTRDDLIETYLMNLVRGAGLRGAAFYPKRRIQGILFLRPLWRRSRAEVMDFLRLHGFSPMEDESNKDVRITRNRIRHKLIPFLEKEFNPRVRDALFNSAATIAEAYRFIRRHARLLYRVAQSRAAVLDSALSIKVLRSAPAIVRREALSLWLEKVIGKRVIHSRSDFEAVERLLNLPSSRMVVLEGGIVIARACEDICACAAPLPPQSEEKNWREAVKMELAHNYLRCHKERLLASLKRPVTLVPQRPKSVKGMAFKAEIETLDGGKRVVEIFMPSQPRSLFDGPLSLRNRRKGDRFPTGKSLKEFFIEQRVPFFLRDFIVLVVNTEDRPLAILGEPNLNRELQRHVEVAQSWQMSWETQ